MISEIRMLWQSKSERNSSATGTYPQYRRRARWAKSWDTGRRQEKNEVRKTHRMNFIRWVYCKVCGEYKSNESFSGSGHAAHICKKCVALSAVQRSEEIRVYLKTVNTPKQRVFSTCWAPFFLAIRRVFLQKMASSGGKSLAASHISGFQIDPKIPYFGFYSLH